jgi:hypothetical protein
MLGGGDTAERGGAEGGSSPSFLPAARVGMSSWGSAVVGAEASVPTRVGESRCAMIARFAFAAVAPDRGGETDAAGGAVTAEAAATAATRRGVSAVASALGLEPEAKK